MVWGSPVAGVMERCYKECCTACFLAVTTSMALQVITLREAFRIPYLTFEKD